MGKIEVATEIAAPASAAWEKIGDFGGLGSWMPGIDKCDVEGEGVGAVRSISMGGTAVKERLERLDAGTRTLAYSIVEAPMPVNDYLATIRVSETGADSCRVDWSATFEVPQGVPEDALAKGLEGAYGGALRALKQQLER
jgi:hypothetical protein